MGALQVGQSTTVAIKVRAQLIAFLYLLFKIWERNCHHGTHWIERTFDPHSRLSTEPVNHNCFRWRGEIHNENNDVMILN